MTAASANRIRRLLIRIVRTGCLALLSPCVALAQESHTAVVPPTGVLVAGFRETATHRPPPSPVRASSQEGMPVEIDLWLHVDPGGRVVDLRSIDGNASQLAAVQDAARALRYKPFERDGIPVEAWIQDTLTLTALPKVPKRTVPFPEVVDPAKVSIQLSRSGCFGTCPSYTVTILGDGTVTYHGDRFVSIAGTRTAHISTAAVSALLNQFRTASFLALDDAYTAGVTDNPTYCLSLNLDGKIKIVTDYVGDWVGMPPQVTALEDAVDTVSDSARWVSASPGTVDAMRQAGIALGSAQATHILLAAVTAGDLVSVRSLLASGTPVTSPASACSDGEKVFGRCAQTPLLQLATQSRKASSRTEMVQTLLSSEAVRADHSGMQRALGLAVESGYLDIARTLIEAGADPNGRLTGEYADQEQKETYLMLAAASGVWKMLDDALARPHDIRAVDANGRTALVNVAYNAPQHEDIFPLIDRLLGAGADRAELDRVLLDTCQANWIPGLVARGGNINARDAKGNTPLFQACTVEGVQALLEAGADPGLRNLAGKTAIQATFTPDHGKDDPRAAVIHRFAQEKASGSTASAR